MIKVGVTQIKNSISIKDNFYSIMRALKHFQLTDTDLILFPECSLSGFWKRLLSLPKKKYVDSLYFRVRHLFFVFELSGQFILFF